MTLINRCYAYVESEHFDVALTDVKAVLQHALEYERDYPREATGRSGLGQFKDISRRALFCGARALYGLGQFKDCSTYIAFSALLYPDKSSNLDIDGLSKHVELRLEDEKGKLDFGAMILEATTKTPSMNRATFIGPVEVRDCVNISRGRSLFLTKDAKAGQLLLCEKAFSAVFVIPDRSLTITSEGTRLEGTMTDKYAQKHLSLACCLKLQRCGSLAASFADLHKGFYNRRDAIERMTLGGLDISPAGLKDMEFSGLDP